MYTLNTISSNYINILGGITGYSVAFARFQAQLDELVALSNELYEAMLGIDARLFAWTRDSQDQNEARLLAANFLRNLEYSDELGSNEATELPGVIGMSKHTQGIIDRYNYAKKDFKALIDDMLKRTDSKKDISFYQQAKKDAGCPRLHYKMCTRLIRYPSDLPNRVGFTESTSKSIKTMTVTKWRKVLSALQNTRNQFLVKHDLDLLNTMDPNEVLAKVISQPSQIRINIGFKKVEKNGDVEFNHLQVKTSLPLFIGMNLTDEPPIISDRTGAMKSTQVRYRSDFRFEKNPLLKSQKVYRYRPEYRT